MPAKKRASTADVSRLRILATGDAKPFLEHVSTLIASGDRLAREAALDALAERPLAEARAVLRQLFDELDADGLKRDQGAPMRTRIVQVLRAVGDVRDGDVAMRACDTKEEVLRQDITWKLRAHGLMMLAELDPDTFPYIAVEHLSDDEANDDGEPANTAAQLLAGTGQYVPLYQWLTTAGATSGFLAPRFELFTRAQPAIVRRFVSGAVETALRQQNEELCTLLAETIVQLELEDAYGQIEAMLYAKISDELYGYLAMLLCSTNRRELLAIIEEQLHHGRRPKMIVEALKVRTTPEQAAILKRWEDRE